LSKLSAASWLEWWKDNKDKPDYRLFPEAGQGRWRRIWE
jgi:hypothetical protein